MADRIPVPQPVDFEATTRKALAAIPHVAAVYGTPLRMLEDIRPNGWPDESYGPTYKQAAYLSHRFGMNKRQRAGWYRLIRRLGLTARHMGHIIARLDASDRLHAELTAISNDVRRNA